MAFLTAFDVLRDLFLAVNAGNLEKVKLCIQWGIDVNAREPDNPRMWTPLMCAIFPGADPWGQYGHTKANCDIIHELIAAGADVNLLTGYGNSTLSLACGSFDGVSSDVDAVKIFLKNGVNTSVRGQIGTALDVASRFKHRDIVAVLFEHMYKCLAKVIHRDLLSIICEFV